MVYVYVMAGRSAHTRGRNMLFEKTITLYFLTFEGCHSRLTFLLFGRIGDAKRFYHTIEKARFGES